MLYNFLIENRANLIDRCRAKVAQRTAPASAPKPSDDGVPLFLDQLIKTLEIEQTHHPLRSRKGSGPSGGGKPVLSEIGETAARHGKALQTHGYSGRLSADHVKATHEAHKRIHAAIAARDPEAAARAMREHIESSWAKRRAARRVDG